MRKSDGTIGKFPDKVLMTIERPDNEPDYLITHDCIDSIGDDYQGKKVGIYKLVETRTLTVTKELK
jgi:hypothetical protein